MNKVNIGQGGWHLKAYGFAVITGLVLLVGMGSSAKADVGDTDLHAPPPTIPSSDDEGTYYVNIPYFWTYEVKGHTCLGVAKVDEVVNTSVDAQYYSGNTINVEWRDVDWKMLKLGAQADSATAISHISGAKKVEVGLQCTHDIYKPEVSVTFPGGAVGNDVKYLPGGKADSPVGFRMAMNNGNYNSSYIACRDSALSEGFTSWPENKQMCSGSALAWASLVFDIVPALRDVNVNLHSLKEADAAGIKSSFIVRFEYN
ncbi:hypothetical protein OP853_004657 [Salmonella enterica]|nr:hypothetical protein [Salmonella enterica]